ncbi:hypothetical protein SY83_01505 [Paenibacillus swuensis]|uniref:Nucleotidyltransferase family protein n=1 Tax=Paenibacillus swuensis TaxID=1178515 RepID=A0A172TP10_9BACL|nr:nucleotidyltransferase family protein [Paenibacillus swuensis]ANE48644.1 hypothetical protein SY83_01505 [Paenibacillus swuensis]
MLIQNKEDLLLLFQTDGWIMDILKTVKTLELPDWWVCAGFVRSKIWDTLHGYRERTPLADVDVIFFDPAEVDEGYEKELELRLQQLAPTIPWSVKNEARMHLVNDIPPYTSSEDAISKFPETATGLGLKLDVWDQVIVTTPWGLEDVLEMNIKPTPLFQSSPELAAIYEKRIVQKNLKSKWPQVTVFHT